MELREDVNIQTTTQSGVYMYNVPQQTGRRRAGSGAVPANWNVTAGTGTESPDIAKRESENET